MSARARKTKSSTGPNVTSAVASSESSGLASKPASLKHMNLNPEEKRFQKELKVAQIESCAWFAMLASATLGNACTVFSTLELANSTHLAFDVFLVAW